MEAYGRISAKRRSRTETERRSHKGTTLQGFTYTVKRFNISMLMEKEPVYLAFSTQKGGAGKTTLTVLVASYLHYVKGYDVAVVDCDYPQHSIAGMRQRDLKLALEDNHYKALAYEQFTRLGKKAYPVVESSTERAIDDADRITEQAAFDLVFFDLPGTVNNPSVIRALSNMDYIIAPISADRVVLESTLRYMTVVNDVIRKTGVSNIKGTYLVWTDCRALHLPSDTLQTRLLETTGLWLNSGTMYGAEGEGFLRWNIACPRSVLQDALSRFKGFVDALTTEE